MAETIRERCGSALYLLKDPFDGVAVAVAGHLEIVAFGAENRDEMIGVVDEKRDAIKLIRTSSLVRG